MSWARLRSHLRRTASDCSGAAAIEFVLIFPVIFMLNIAAAEALEVYEAQRNVSHIAAAIADITAQSHQVSNADLDDIFAASVSMIHPFPNLAVQQRVSSVSADSHGTIRVDWTANKAYTGADDPGVPSGYLAANESAIVTDVVYDYHPQFGMFLPSTIRFVRHAYVRPRLTAKVEKVS
ncbi:MAG: pilus assembly protein [Caulobacterales bacterium]|nr:pilus assembly protein [Caulobacterales bacterium]